MDGPLGVGILVDNYFLIFLFSINLNLQYLGSIVTSVQMPSDVNSIEIFCNVAEASRLIESEHLSNLTTNFRDQSKEFQDQQEELLSFADYLIDNEALTPWQADKLLKGKPRGFFIGNYVLLSRLSGLLPKAIYQARDINTGLIVSLEINVPFMNSPMKDITYRVITESSE